MLFKGIYLLAQVCFGVVKHDYCNKWGERNAFFFVAITDMVKHS